MSQQFKSMSLIEAKAISAVQSSIVLDQFHFGTDLTIHADFQPSELYHGTLVDFSDSFDDLITGCFHADFQPSTELYYGTPIGFIDPFDDIKTPE